MRCEECGRVIENEEMWRLGGDPNAPTSRSMLQMCWECRTRGVPAYQQKAQATPSTLSKTLIAEINEAVGTFEPGAA
ncbi:MAG TPA: hypothetical protein VF040_15170 [Ktedonobacterales bacterium]